MQLTLSVQCLDREPVFTLTRTRVFELSTIGKKYLSELPGFTLILGNVKLNLTSTHLLERSGVEFERDTELGLTRVRGLGQRRSPGGSLPQQQSGDQSYRSESTVHDGTP